MEKNPAKEDGGVAKGSDTKEKEDSIQEKKRPSEKKIHRKQKPEEVPDFLLIDSSVIPKERDPRYLDNGYDYQHRCIFCKASLRVCCLTDTTNQNKNAIFCVVYYMRRKNDVTSIDPLRGST